MLQAILFWDCILTRLGSVLCQGVTRDLVEEPRFILPSQATATPVSRKRPCKSGQWHPGSKSCKELRTGNVRCKAYTTYNLYLPNEPNLQCNLKLLKPHLPVLLYTLENGQPFFSPQRSKNEGCYRLTNTGSLLAALVTSVALGGFERDCAKSKTRKPENPLEEWCLHDGIHHAEGCFLFKTQLQEDCSRLVPQLNCEIGICNGLQAHPVKKPFR